MFSLDFIQLGDNHYNFFSLRVHIVLVIFFCCY